METEVKLVADYPDLSAVHELPCSQHNPPKKHHSAAWCWPVNTRSVHMGRSAGTSLRLGKDYRTSGLIWVLLENEGQNK